MKVSQGGEKGGSSDFGGEKKGKLVGKVFATQIAIPIPIKPIQTMTKTTT